MALLALRSARSCDRVLSSDGLRLSPGPLANRTPLGGHSPGIFACKGSIILDLHEAWNSRGSLVIGRL